MALGRVNVIAVAFIVVATFNVVATLVGVDQMPMATKFGRWPSSLGTFVEKIL